MEYITSATASAFGLLKRGWLFCVIWFCLVGIAPSPVCAQTRTGSAKLRGSISKTVTLSLSPHDSPAGVEFHALENEGALTLTLSGAEFKRNLQVAILIRSNTAYSIKASVQSEEAVLTKLQVLRVEATGKLVGGDAVTGVSVKPVFDTRLGGSLAGEEDLSAIDASVPFTIFSGPRISLGGGLDSLHNALKVILLLSVQPKVTEGSWTVNLTLQGNGVDTP